MSGYLLPGAADRLRVALISKHADAGRARHVPKEDLLQHMPPCNADPVLLRFVPNAAPTLAALASAGYALVLVTNQNGLAVWRHSPLRTPHARCTRWEEVAEELLAHDARRALPSEAATP